MVRWMLVCAASLLLVANTAQDSWALLEEGRDAEALEQATQASAEGEAEAFAVLGAIYEDGRGIAPDQDKAAAFYKQGAAMGDSYSQWRLGVMIDLGQSKGTPKDAVALFEKAAAAGNASAMASLAVMHASGRGVPQNFDKAWELYERTARAGEPHGLFGLGVMHINGEGRPADKLAAAACWLVAGLEGSEAARDAIVQVGPQLSEAQLERLVPDARKIAQQYGFERALAELAEMDR